MNWRFRKSFTIVPGLRLNLSKGGLSASIGASPFTLNVSPRGFTGTTSIPGTGISQRQTLSFGRDDSDQPAAPHPHSLYTTANFQATPIQYVHSASTERMTSACLAEVKELIQTAYQQHAGVERELQDAWRSKVDAQTNFEDWNSGFFLRRIRPKHFATLKEQADTEAARVNELEEQLQLSRICTQIDIDDQQAELFYRMRDAFAGLSECAAIWDVKTKQATDRFHERTTANERIWREHVQFRLGECDLILWTQKVPHLANAKGGDLYLYPGFILYRAARQAFSLIDYHDVVVTSSSIQFHEDGIVPRDAEIIGQTWFKSNKDGSRDKRFTGNYQLPIAHYGALCLRSGNGLWEEFYLSDPNKISIFTASLNLFTESFCRHSDISPSETDPGSLSNHKAAPTLLDCYKLLGLTRPAPLEEASQTFNKQLAEASSDAKANELKMAFVRIKLDLEGPRFG